MSNQVTITFGTSVHFFKSSVSVTFDKNIDETLKDIDDVKERVTKLYYNVLAQELLLTKKFEKMTTKEIKNFLKKKLREK